MTNNILITGGAGFIGSHLALSLLRQGHNITVLDNLSPQIHKDASNSPSFLAIKGKVNFILGDVRTKRDWLKAIRNQDIVIHLAAETGTGQSMYQVHRYVNTNTLGISILLDILANTKHRVKKILLASSRAVYGEGKYLCPEHGIVYPATRKKDDLLNHEFQCKCPYCHIDVSELATDENSQTNPVSVYGITKLVQEQLLLNISKSLEIPCVIFRFQNVYGPFQSLSNPYTGILSIFSNLLINDKDVFIFEDGQESRDFVYISDVIKALELGLTSDNGNFDIFNVGSAKKTTVMEIASILKMNYRAKSNIIINNQFRIGDIRHNFADLAKIKKCFDFTPVVDISSGLRDFSEWVITQELSELKYQDSLSELRRRGLMK